MTTATVRDARDLERALEDVPLVVVDLDSVDLEAPPPDLRATPAVVVGRTTHLTAPARAWSAAMTLTLAPSGIGHTWVDAPLEPVVEAVQSSPGPVGMLTTLLRITASCSVPHGLAAESATYSALLGSPQFLRWRGSTPVRPVPVVEDPVLLTREGDELTVVLNRPERRNAFGRQVRDGLREALAVARHDTSIERVTLHGAGQAFCSGGDLDEFGTAADPATAHGVRLRASAGLAVHRLADRVVPHLHGACVGAGIEVPAFADHVVADPQAWFALPEVSMGLVPGAGGTVSLTHRIGRWRTAWMALTGARVDAVTARRWGLVDEVAPVRGDLP